MNEPVRCPKCRHRTTDYGRRFCFHCEPCPHLGLVIAKIQRLRTEAERQCAEEESEYDYVVDALDELLRFLRGETCALCMDAQKDGDDACFEHTTRSKAV